MGNFIFHRKWGILNMLYDNPAYQLNLHNRVPTRMCGDNWGLFSAGGEFSESNEISIQPRPQTHNLHTTNPRSGHGEFWVKMGNFEITTD